MSITRSALILLAVLVLAPACHKDKPTAKPLKLLELQPSSGHPAGGKIVQITGEGFDTHSKVEVMFGDKPARAIVVAKDRIQVESPPGKEDQEVEVTVSFPDGRSGKMPQKYRWELPVLQPGEDLGLGRRAGFGRRAGVGRAWVRRRTSAQHSSAARAHRRRSLPATMFVSAPRGSMVSRNTVTMSSVSRGLAVFIVVALAVVPRLASAHDTSMTYADLVVDGSNVAVTMTVAPSELTGR